MERPLRNDTGRAFVRVRVSGPSCRRGDHGEPEAVFLPDKVIGLSPRPSRVARIFEIALPRLREFSVCYTKEFGEYCGAIRAEIKR